MLYQETREGGMLSIIKAFQGNEQDLNIAELKLISTRLKADGYAVFQLENQGRDMRGQITSAGGTLVEQDSYSRPGTSILDLQES